MTPVEIETKSASKVVIIAAMICLAAIATYFFHVVAKTGVLFTHLFYVPIALAALWWRRGAVIVAAILSLQLLSIHVLSSPAGCSLAQDSIRCVMFFAVGSVLARVQHKNREAHDLLAEEIKVRENKIRESTDQLLASNRQLSSEVDQIRKIEEITAKLSNLKEHLLSRIDIEDKLKMITDEIVDIFDADFARIWIIDEGDLCEKGCIHASATEEAHICRDRSACLHLVASSGRYTRIDGTHRRIPIGCYKIGRIASGMIESFITNDVVHDARVHDHEWAASIGLVSFAGYRLVSADGSPVGVMALFSRYAMPKYQHAMIEDLASTVSQLLSSSIIERQMRDRLEILEELNIYNDERDRKIRDLEERLAKYEKGPTRRWDSPAV